MGWEFMDEIGKYIDICKNGVNSIHIADIDQLIKFFEKEQEFEKCEYLLKLKNEK